MASDGFSQPRRQSRQDRVPLLQTNPDPYAASLVSDALPVSTSMKKARTKWLTLLLVGTLTLVFEAGNAMRTAALIASYEEVVCQDLFEHVAESTTKCSKSHAVETELARILGVSQFLECLPILLLSGVYGSMADRYGRRPILLLGYLGMILSSTWVTCIAWLGSTVSLRLVWLGPIFTIIGGGPGVPISILMTSAADVVLESQRVTVFSFIHGTALVAVMLGSLFGSLTMTILGNFSPLLTGLTLMCLALVLGTLLPSTIQPAMALSTVCDDASDTRYSEGSRPLTPTKPQADRGSTLRVMSLSFSDLWQTNGVMSLLIAGFVSMIGQQVQVLILQYMPNKFSMSLAETNIFNVLISIVNLLVLMALLPLASELLLRRFGYTNFRKDLVLAHASCLLFLTGGLALSTAQVVPIAVIGFIIFGAGIGLSSLIRSIFVELFPPEHAAYATMLISAAKSMGGSLSGPVYSYAFALSLDLANILQGLPFLVSVACFAIVELSLITMRTNLRRNTIDT